jgi:hypothetical protein
MAEATDEFGLISFLGELLELRDQVGNPPQKPALPKN